MQIKRILTACSLPVIPAVLPAQEITGKLPNILIITADDLGWNDVSSTVMTMGHGSRNHQTPNIDRLALQGMTFTTAYTQQNSAPTRAALLTGMYANSNGVYNVFGLDRYSPKGISEEDARIIPPDQGGESISPSTTTFAEMLRNAGYDTYIFGKVHGWDGDLDKDHGFNHDYSCYRVVKSEGEQSNYFALQNKEGKWIFDSEKYDSYAVPYTAEYIEKKLMPFANGNDPAQLAGTPKHLTDAIGDCVTDRLAEAGRDKPFCMWVCFHAIHSVIESREDMYEKYRGRTDLDERHTNYKYAALTEQLDQTVGRILAALDDPDGDGDNSDSIAGETIVIFSSDNGGAPGAHSNSPLRAMKGTLYEGGIRVPLTVRYPGVILPAVSEEPVHVIDYLPTLAEIAGQPVGKEVDGVSIWGLLTGRETEPGRESLFWHFPGYLDNRLEPSSLINKKIGDKRYKLRYSYEYDKYELYCLSDDLSEENELLAGDQTDRHLAIAREMHRDLCRWLRKSKPLEMKYKAGGKKVGLPPKP